MIIIKPFFKNVTNLAIIIASIILIKNYVSYEIIIFVIFHLMLYFYMIDKLTIIPNLSQNILLTTSIYFGCSAFTYINVVQQSSQEALLQKILLELIVGLTILLSILLNKKYNKYSLKVYFNKNMLLIGYIDVLIKLLLIFKGYSAPYNSEAVLNVNNAGALDLIVIVFSNVVASSSILVSFVSLHHPRGKKALPILFLLLNISWILFFSGSRYQILFIFCAYIVSLKLFDKVVVFEYLKLIIKSIPIIIMFSMTSILNLLGRESDNDFKTAIYEVSYRFSFTDFTIPFLSDCLEIEDRIKIISDSFYYALPRLFFSEKPISIDGIANAQSLCGLSPYVDYTDTLFSFGAMVFGPFLFFLVYIIFLLLFFYIDRYLNNVKLGEKFIGKISLLLIIYSFQIEIGPAEFFLKIRDFLILALIVYFISRVIKIRI